MSDVKYDKLDKSVDYDHDAVDQLASAMTELRDLKSRASYLEDLIKENSELHPFIWVTAEGEVLPHHKIEDDHFKNILLHIVNNGRKISKELKSEARKRNIPIPTMQHPYRANTLAAIAARVYEATQDDDGEDINITDIDF